MRLLGILLTAIVLVAGCDSEEKVDRRKELHDAARAAAREAGQLVKQGNPEAARENYLRARRQALEALEVPGEPPRAAVLSLLSGISCELGLYSPRYFGDAVRFAEAALDEAPGAVEPWFNLGLAYERSAFQAKAVAAYERFIETLPEGIGLEEAREGARTHLITVLSEMARLVLKRDLPGAEGRARRLLERAWAIRANASTNPTVLQNMERIGARYQESANTAAREKDLLGLAAVHARFGYFQPAREAMAKVVAQEGQSARARWVEARYIDELEGTPESLRRAADAYAAMMDRGEQVLAAAAGYARTMLALGEGEKALARLGNFPEPGAELRTALIQLRLDELARLPRETPADDKFDALFELMLGDLDETDRAELLVNIASVALSRENVEQTERFLRALQSRFPRDLRVVVLDAGLAKLKGVPLPSLSGEKDG